VSDWGYAIPFFGRRVVKPRYTLVNCFDVRLKRANGPEMQNMSSGYKDLRSAAPVEESKQVTASGTGPSVGQDGPSVTERAAPGSEGPGMGNAKVLNSDGQMPGPSYPYGG